MSPEEFKRARFDLGLSAAQLARILGVNPRTIRKWEDGSRQPNETAVRVMAWLVDGYRPPQWPKHTAARPLP